jgi:hypothetical protein
MLFHHEITRTGRAEIVCPLEFDYSALMAMPLRLGWRIYCHNMTINGIFWDLAEKYNVSILVLQMCQKKTRYRTDVR